MCSITASFDTDKLVELAKMNEYRGTHSHSICYVRPGRMNVIQELKRGLGPLPYHEINIPEGMYGIVHQQAPTTDSKDETSIHPAQIANRLLWHNGIVKDGEVKRLNEFHMTNYSWDTMLILRQLIDYGHPDNIDGTFSCVYFDDERILVIRNEISPLFIDDDLNISSTKFAGSESLPANEMFELDLWMFPGYTKIGKDFGTVENPYYFGD